MMRGAREARANELRIEHTIGHHLTAQHEARLVGAVVGNRVVERPDVVPHEEIAFGPHVLVLILLLKLMVVLVLVALYLAALPVISRLEPPVRRGRAFIQVHVAALLLGSVAAFLGLLIHG